ncbi:MAG: helix-turn-helix domain-containing protein [Candidatus Enterosoma sp.]|nr:helix-turn-helix domain-containing protein [Candidatus Enterosoma sp.]
MTQTEFAEFLGVSFASINRWEGGLFEPTMKVKRKLAPLFKENEIEVE